MPEQLDAMAQRLVEEYRAQPLDAIKRALERETDPALQAALYEIWDDAIRMYTTHDQKAIDQRITSVVMSSFSESRAAKPFENGPKVTTREKRKKHGRR